MLLLCFVPVRIVLLFLRFVLGCLKQIIRLVKFRLSFLLVFFVCLFVLYVIVYIRIKQVTYRKSIPGKFHKLRCQGLGIT